MSEKRTKNARKTHACDSINRIGAIIRACSHIKDDAVAYDVKEALLAMPSAEPKRFSNKEWIDFFS